MRVPATLKESGVCGKMGLVFSVCLLFLGGEGSFIGSLCGRKWRLMIMRATLLTTPKPRL